MAYSLCSGHIPASKFAFIMSHIQLDRLKKYASVYLSLSKEKKLHTAFSLQKNNTVTFHFTNLYTGTDIICFQYIKEHSNKIKYQPKYVQTFKSRVHTRKINLINIIAK